MSHRVLIVDDEQSLLNAVQRCIGEDYEVTTAGSGEEALEILQEQGPFSVVVTDMRMPHMDGFTFAQEANKLYPESVLIMLTGNLDQAIAAKTLRQTNVFRYLNKPCEMSELRAVVAEAIQEYEKLTCV